MDIKETIDYCMNMAVTIGLDYAKELDFSDESIRLVDEILDGYHERYLYPEKDEGLIKEHSTTYAHIFGIYVGEVLLRNHANGYVWADTDMGLALAKGEQNRLNPVGKAYKQITGGKESGDDIKSFFDVAVIIMEKGFPVAK